MKFKKVLSAVLALAMAASLAACGSTATASSTEPASEPAATEAPAETTETAAESAGIRIAGLKGPTTMGLVNLIAQAEAGQTAQDYAFTMYGAADEIVPLLVKGELDAAAIPANLAATLYQKTGGALEVACINTLGVLYVVELGNNIQSVEDLKGAPHLVRAWMKHTGKHPHDALVLIGMGNRYDELKARYGQCKTLFLEGRVPYDDVHRYYAAADVFILPTLLDNWSLVIPEAMACSLPVATSIYNGCHPELIREGENGTVFDPLREDSLTRALDYFHHADLRAHGSRSAEIEKEWSTECCARRVFDCLTREV